MSPFYWQWSAWGELYQIIEFALNKSRFNVNILMAFVLKCIQLLIHNHINAEQNNFQMLFETSHLKSLHVPAGKSLLHEENEIIS